MVLITVLLICFLKRIKDYYCFDRIARLKVKPFTYETLQRPFQKAKLELVYETFRTYTLEINKTIQTSEETTLLNEENIIKGNFTA